MKNWKHRVKYKKWETNNEKWKIEEKKLKAKKEKLKTKNQQWKSTIKHEKFNIPSKKCKKKIEKWKTFLKCAFEILTLLNLTHLCTNFVLVLYKMIHMLKEASKFNDCIAKLSPSSSSS